jgi:hypothetical protein
MGRKKKYTGEDVAFDYLVMRKFPHEIWLDFAADNDCGLDLSLDELWELMRQVALRRLKQHYVCSKKKILPYHCRVSLNRAIRRFQKGDKKSYVNSYRAIELMSGYFNHENLIHKSLYEHLNNFRDLMLNYVSVLCRFDKFIEVQKTKNLEIRVDSDGSIG